METTAQKTKRIIAETLGIDRNLITYDTDLRKEFNVDSLDFVEVVTILEKEFHTSIPDEKVERMRKIGDFIEHFEKTRPIRLHHSYNLSMA